MQKGVLKVLNTLLKIEGEVQIEAVGAIRNLTLDERYLGDFADTEIIDSLIDIMPHANSHKLMTCVLCALRNLSRHKRNQEQMGTVVGIANMMAVLKEPSNPLIDQKHVLESLLLMSINPKVHPGLADSKIEELLLSLVSSQNDLLAILSKKILNNMDIATNWPSSHYLVPVHLQFAVCEILCVISIIIPKEVQKYLVQTIIQLLAPPVIYRHYWK